MTADTQLPTHVPCLKYVLFTFLISIFKQACYLGMSYLHAAFQNGWTITPTTEKS